MARRVSLAVVAGPRGAPSRYAPVALLVLLSAALLPPPCVAAAERATTLASYSFDDSVATGPDSFAVFQGGKGQVRLSDAFHVSGYRSVELKDVAGDGDFPELQGYFPVRREGRLYFHFAFLTTDPAQELNIALAGPRFFQMDADGIAFWLATREGVLVHVSDSIPKKLFAPEPFVWYLADVVYDLDAGRYDLTLRREGREEPLAALVGQPNATSRPGSAVDKFSFVGSPFGDNSNVVFYVDDVVIATDQEDAPQGLVAPGRRKLFVDAFAEYQGLLAQRPRCLPVADFAQDFDLSHEEVGGLAREQLWALLQALLSGGEPGRAGAGQTSVRGQAVLEAARDWQQGCLALERGAPQQALSRFDAAASRAPGAPIVALSQALALAGLKRVEEADLRLGQLGAMRDDPRYAVASAYVGLARGDLDRALAWVRDPAARVLDREANPFLWLFDPKQWTLERFMAMRQALTDETRLRVEETFITEQYYFVQLWKGDAALARDFALAMSERLRRAELPWALWGERAGDASFFRRDLREAAEQYERARGADASRAGLLDLKLADVAFLRGDFEGERALRERYYGALRER